MRRFVVLIAVLFTFAATMGATVAHAHRYVSTPIVVLNHVNAQNQSIPVFVQVQHGQIDLGTGIVMPCGAHPAIEVERPALPVAPDCAPPEWPPDTASVSWSGILPLRPPIAA